MARRGENIYKRKDGRWEGRLPIYNKQNKIEKYHNHFGTWNIIFLYLLFHLSSIKLEQR